MVANDSGNTKQSQPAAMATLFGSEKCVKNFFGCSCRYPPPRIRKGNLQVYTRRGVALSVSRDLRQSQHYSFSFNLETSPVWHGIPSVQTQIQKRLIQMGRVAPDAADIHANRCIDPDG